MGGGISGPCALSHSSFRQTCLAQQDQGGSRPEAKGLQYSSVASRQMLKPQFGRCVTNNFQKSSLFCKIKWSQG